VQDLYELSLACFAALSRVWCCRSQPLSKPQARPSRSDAQLPVWAVGCGVAAVALTATCVAGAGVAKAKPENPGPSVL
jgi:hypothetical protein